MNEWRRDFILPLFMLSNIYILFFHILNMGIFTTFNQNAVLMWEQESFPYFFPFL